MPYEDHYSGHAHAYARHRPRYPDALFAWLASVVPGHRLAWDVGTGNGQVAVALADHFAQVIATDASADQLAHAATNDRVVYRNEHADSVFLPPASVDLITAGAAAHWFELDGFYREVRRVGKPGAVIALFSYGPRDLADAVDPSVHRFQEEVLAGFWPEGIQYVNDRYTTLPFPFDEIAAAPFAIAADWTLEDLVAILGTWSASQRFVQARGREPLDEILDDLTLSWGDPMTPRHFEWPLFMRVGRL
jgi:SAM-dependent methyltransferase